MTKLSDRIYGCIFGCAVGDALGLGSEFMTRREVRHYYPGGLHSYDQIVRDAHRSQYPPASWTNDTEIMLQCATSMAETDSFDCTDFARRLADWYSPERDDIAGVFRALLPDPEFIVDPIATSKRTWDRMGGVTPSNEAAPRIPLAGLWNENVRNNARRMSAMTHYHPRCLDMSEAIALTVQAMTYRNHNITPDEIEAICSRTDENVPTFISLARSGNLDEMRLDDEDGLWWVRRAVGSAFWALWHTDSFEEGLLTVVNQGGDADTNGALTGALLGVKYGYSSIPHSLIVNLREPQVLEDVASRLAAVIERRFGADARD